MAIVRLTGGLTPPDGSDPRTFPAIWNGAVDDIEAAESDITTLTNRLDTIDTDDVAEGSNLYFTDARADARATAVIGQSTTDDLSEGVSNLYYTDGRVDAVIAGSDTDDLSEGAVNLYYTDARVEAVIASSTTDDLSEGALNLYYTDGRASDAAPVQSVNGAVGTVVLGPADVGAYPDTNPDGFVDAAGAATAAPVQSVNTQSGTVVLTAADVGALPGTAMLGDLADVDVTGVADGQIIAYNATSGVWELASPAGITTGDITALNLTWADF